MMFDVPTRGFCKQANKYKQSKRLAELTADKMAWVEWQKGSNASFHAYPCEFCLEYHVGHNKRAEPIVDGKVVKPMHQFYIMSAPMTKIPRRYFEERN